MAEFLGNGATFQITNCVENQNIHFMSNTPPTPKGSDAVCEIITKPEGKEIRFLYRAVKMKMPKRNNI